MTCKRLELLLKDQNKKQTQKPIAYHPIKKTGHFKERIAALDFETEGKGGKSLCVSYAVLDYDGKIVESNIFTGKDHIDKMMDVIFSVGPNTIWYSHFGQYDWRYLFNWLIENREDLNLSFGLRTETQVYNIEMKPYGDEENKIILRDSFAMWPGKLEDLTAKFAPDHAKLTGIIDFEKENFDIHNQKHLEYALRDSESLALAMFNLNKAIIKLYKVPMGHTTAGTALKAWRRMLTKPIFVNRATMKFMRKAYYGGLVFLTDTHEHKNCKSFDINSSYPNVMRKFSYPVGNPIKTKNWIDTRLPAIYHCKITAPDFIRIPIIPFRDKKGITKWMRGNIETYCTNYEIQFALDHGYTNFEIIEGYFWRDTIEPFKEFVDMSEKIRAENKGTPTESLVKLIQNSLYGKFGTRQERRVIFFPEKMEEIIESNAQPLDENDILWVKTEEDPDILCHPAWASFITAHARLELLKNIYDNLGVENCLYGDTDSITVKENTDFSKLSIGNIYGQFKMDKEWKEFKALAPKVYAGKIKNIKGDYWTGACKGIPVNKKQEDAFFQELYEKEMLVKEYETLQSFWLGMKAGFVPAAMVERKSTNIENSGSWELHTDGTIWPKKLNN